MAKFKKFILALFILSSGAAVSAEEISSEEASHDFFIIPEFIYWRTTGNGLFYATRSEGASFVKGRVKNLDFAWDPGFRIGAGGNLPWDEWDLFLSFTHLHTKTRTISSADGEFLLPSWTAVSSKDGYVESANARWRLHLGLLDFELGRKFFATKRVALRPFIGSRTAWIRQKYHIFYEGGSLFKGEVDHLSMKNKFWGMGIRLGMDSSWVLPAGWSLYAEAAYALLYGDIYVHESETFPSQKEPFRIHDDYAISRSTTDLSIGINWEKAIGGYLLGFHAGWEQHLLLGQNQFLHFDDPSIKGSAVTNQGDLTLQGVTVGASFYF